MKILVVLPRFPYPLEKGDKLRAYHQIRTLSANNEVYLFALSHEKVGEDAIQEMRRYCKDIRVERLSKFKGMFRVLRNFLTVRSMQIGYWDSARARNRYRDFESKVAPDVVYAQMVRVIKYVAYSPYPKVLDFQDALSMNFERRMCKHRSLPYFALHYEFKMLRSAEYNACSIFDGLTIISENDAEAIPQHKNTVINVVPNGVDLDYYTPQQMPKRYDVVFCGNMQYQPNIDAAKYLVYDIMPLVWRSHPEARVLIAGATPKPSVLKLTSDKVEVSGSVPDIRPCYASSKVFVAPMRIGSGLQNKLLEAMSMGIPCVTTSLANESLQATVGKDILVGDDAQGIASAIVSLLDNPQDAERQAANASGFVRSRFSWQSSSVVLEEVLKKAILTHGSHEAAQLEE
ncbi:MAG: glycosyltransferase [Bacteroidales bacterium]|nr:glycosyltransferase [Bacteroidales bacterium]